MKKVKNLIDCIISKIVETYLLFMYNDVEFGEIYENRNRY